MANFVYNTYDYIDRIRLFVTFVDLDGAAIDPAAVRVMWRNTITNTTNIRVFGVDVEVVKTAVGAYYTDIDIDEENDNEMTWYYRWEGTGAGAQGAAERQFKIRETQFY